VRPKQVIYWPNFVDRRGRYYDNYYWNTHRYRMLCRFSASNDICSFSITFWCKVDYDQNPKA